MNTLKENSLDELLERLPEIAEVVNQFSSPAVQERAFEVCIQDFRDKAGLPYPMATEVKPQLDIRENKSDKEPNGTKKKRGQRRAFSPDKDVNLRPQDKPSFRDYAAEKNPTNNDERNTVAVYYLSEILGLKNVKLSQVLACYRECDWRSPSNPANSVQVTASKHGWLNSADAENLILTNAGRNLVEFDLPKAKQ